MCKTSDVNHEIHTYGSTLPTYCLASSPGACVFRRTSLLDIGGFDTTIWGADDFDVIVRMCKRYRVVQRKNVVLYHRIHDHNASHNASRMSFNIGKSICKNYTEASFATLIRLSYWYGAYGPFIFFDSLLKLVSERGISKSFIIRFVGAFVLGRTICRLK
jgi:hypothetical protein